MAITDSAVVHGKNAIVEANPAASKVGMSLSLAILDDAAIHGEAAVIAIDKHATAFAFVALCDATLDCAAIVHGQRGIVKTDAAPVYVCIRAFSRTTIPNHAARIHSHTRTLSVGIHGTTAVGCHTVLQHSAVIQN